MLPPERASRGVKKTYISKPGLTIVLKFSQAQWQNSEFIWGAQNLKKFSQHVLFSVELRFFRYLIQNYRILELQDTIKSSFFD